MYPFKNRTFISGLFISFLSIVFTQCTRYVANPNACYNDKVKNLLVTHCAGTGCHNSQDKEKGFDFTNYDGVMKAVKAKHALQSELYTVLNRTGEEQMPPNYSLSKEEKAMIKNWINNGALNNSCVVQTCDSSQITYSKVSKVLQANCTGCHNKNNVSGGIVLDTYSGVLASQNNNNRLLGSIQHETGYSAMPKFTAQLSACDIRLIEKWVETGMPNN